MQLSMNSRQINVIFNDETRKELVEINFKIRSNFIPVICSDLEHYNFVIVSVNNRRTQFNKQIKSWSEYI